MTRHYQNARTRLSAAIYIHKDGTATLKVRKTITQEVVLRNTYRSEQIAYRIWRHLVDVR